MRSVSEAFRPAWDHMVHTLFRPFRMDHWFELGFSAFLMSLGSGGGGGNWAQMVPNPDRGSGLEGLQGVKDWVMGHLPLVLGVGAVVLLILLGIGAVLVWLSSRGTFMFLDNVATGRSAIAAPWSRFRTQGNALALFRFGAGLVTLLLAVGLGVGAWMVAQPDIQAERFGAHALTAVLGGGLLMLILILGAALLLQVVQDFVTQIMVLRGVGVLEGLGIFGREALPGHVGSLIAYFLVKFVAGMAGGIALVIAGCATCCIGFLPYLSSVLALPLLVFLRAFSLHFLAQLGPEWRLMPEAEA